MKNSVGIALRYLNSTRSKISILDKNYGKIEGITNLLTLCSGSLLSYDIDKQNNYFFFKNMEIIYIPLTLASSDIIFFHHVLELIYYFNPANYSVKNLFELIAFLYTIENMVLHKNFKKFFLLKLLTFLEITPEIENIHSHSITQLCTIDIKQFKEELINNENEKKLDQWLFNCINQHPHSNKFKTVHFLKKTG